MDNKEFKLPSEVKEEVKKEAQANPTVLVQTIQPVYAYGNYYNGGVKFMTDKALADEWVKAGTAVIVG